MTYSIKTIIILMAAATLMAGCYDSLFETPQNYSSENGDDSYTNTHIGDSCTPSSFEEFCKGNVGYMCDNDSRKVTRLDCNAYQGLTCHSRKTDHYTTCTNTCNNYGELQKACTPDGKQVLISKCDYDTGNHLYWFDYGYDTCSTGTTCTQGKCLDIGELPEPSCGNGLREEGELCDSENVGSATCESVKGAGYKGKLRCNAKCNGYDTSACIFNPSGTDDPVEPCICEENESCVNGHCQPNEDCSCNDGAVCIGGICVVPEEGEACANMPPTCFNGNTVKSCSNDKIIYTTCPYSKVCSAGQCIHTTTSGCNASNPCPSGYVCEAGSCVDQRPTICNNNQLICGYGKDIITCADNHYILYKKCTEKCENGECVITEPECHENQKQCTDDGKIKICINGLWETSNNICEYGCANGTCLVPETPPENECAQGDTKCDGTSLLVCRAGKWVRTDCGTNKVCQEGACVDVDLCNGMICTDGKQCVNGTCIDKEIVCIKNNTLCRDDVVYACNGEAWLAQSDCAADGMKCKDGLCFFEQECGNGILEDGEECDDGNIFIYDGCSDDCRIESVPECETGTTTCLDAVTIRVCINGRWDASNVCVDQYHCVDGICVPYRQCGNGILEDGEICDGNQFKLNYSCGTVLGPDYTGELKCTGDCQIDSSDCYLKDNYCTQNEDCAEGICERKRCVWECEADADCASHGDGRTICDAHRCIEESILCTDGERTCQDIQTIALCQSGAWLESVCSEDTVCNTETLTCDPINALDPNCQQFAIEDGRTICQTCKAGYTLNGQKCTNEGLPVTLNWCIFKYYDEANAIGYGQLLPPDGHPDVHAYMACTTDLNTPIYDEEGNFLWEAIEANYNITIFGTNEEYMTSRAYEAQPGTNYCTFIFDFYKNNSIYACTPKDEPAISVNLGITKLEEDQTWEFIQRCEEGYVLDASGTTCIEVCPEHALYDAATHTCVCDVDYEMKDDVCVLKTNVHCGNGIINTTEGEECDDGLNNRDDAYGGCTTQCKLGPHCGNGIIEAVEECDTTALNGASCQSLVGSYSIGYINCNADCTYNTNNCTRCPNTICGDACVDLNIDPENCGSCHNACASGVCIEGVCGCDEGETKCDGNNIAYCMHHQYQITETCTNGCSEGKCNICNPGERACLDGYRLSTCTGKSWRTDSVCESKCEDLSCKTGCPTNAAYCSDFTTLATCVHGDWVVESCAGNLECDNGKSRCVCNETDPNDCYQINGTIKFGHYLKSSPFTTWEPIEWQIIKLEEDRLLLWSKNVIDQRPYHINMTNVTWETSTIRSWLNGLGASHNEAGIDYTTDNFLTKAFTAQELSQIITVTNQNPNNPNYTSTQGGNATQDRVFLLSYAEKRTTGIVLADATEYAANAGVFTNSAHYGKLGVYWLRTPGATNQSAMVITLTSQESMYDVTSTSAGIRPAVWIKKPQPFLPHQRGSQGLAAIERIKYPIIDTHILFIFTVSEVTYA